MRGLAVSLKKDGRTPLVSVLEHGGPRKTTAERVGHHREATAWLSAG
ncbi:MAG: hypothetical protein UW94_C0002G0061 [Parcubacteria group bacterium GW2011_GWA2_45_14]|nr:MAG: hypothetical protein UW94_C0002G0061 [Parcubacteria group bacterium GW2011_GWA2_45_14]